MKKVTINNKEYEISCNAFTKYLYRTTFNSDIFKDFKTLNDYNVKSEKIKEEIKDEKEREQAIQDLTFESITEITMILERLAYIEILTANRKFMSFEEWLSGIDSLDLEGSWVSEVTELAVNSFHG